MGLLSKMLAGDQSARFSEGVEVEETFPEPSAGSAVTPAPEAAPVESEDVAPDVPPRLTVVPRETAAEPAAPARADLDAVYEAQLERRLREAETLVKQTIERMRIEEEQRLTEWVRSRRDEEERRLQQWIDERRAAVERSLELRSSHDDALATRIESMLVEWQSRFEQRLEQRRADEERLAERRRASDEERLRAWRSELEQALADRFSDRRISEPAAPVRPEVRATTREALRSATSTRDVGRLLRDVLSDMARTSAFALSVHHTGRDEVAYRYRVASEDELGAMLRRETLDDGPRSAVAFADGWLRTHRTVRAGARTATVHTAQCAVRDGETTIGVLTLQSESEPIADEVLARVSELAAVAAPRLAELRHEGAFRGA